MLLLLYFYSNNCKGENTMQKHINGHENISVEFPANGKNLSSLPPGLNKQKINAKFALIYFDWVGGGGEDNFAK